MSFVESLFNLRESVVVVTGGGGALPSSIAVAFAKAGAKVALWGRGTHHPMAKAADLVKEQAELPPDSPNVAGITVDTASTTACAAAFDETVRSLGMPDILLNGVGGNMGRSSFLDFDEKVFDEVVRLNLMAGLMVPSRIFAKRWIGAGVEGSIINMTSMASYKGLSAVWAYDAAKAGVLNLTQTLAKELAPHGIRVNAVAPGFFVGNQNRALLFDETTGKLTARGQAIIARTPFGRFGEYEELWGAVLYLANPKASGFVTGVSIPVDGGYLSDNI
jgi:NAD(P)-dependent dehydrogenase (short-subunit alcohol dehydrogenase family)